MCLCLSYFNQKKRKNSWNDAEALVYLDLHIHTTISDGQKSTEEILMMAKACNVSVLAITNHDLTENIAAQKLNTDIQLIEGIELSAKMTNETEVHILGYNIDSTHPKLCTVCQSIIDSRAERFQKMITILQQQGINIHCEEIQLGQRGLASRMHIAYALAEKGYAPDPVTAIDRYLSPGTPAYIPNDAIPLRDAIELIKEAGGVPVLAHPMRYKLIREHIELLIKVCKSYGLKGIEAYYPTHQVPDREFLLRCCNRMKLIPTCGTDYHRGNNEDYMQKLKKCGMNKPSPELLELINNGR